MSTVMSAAFPDIIGAKIKKTPKKPVKKQAATNLGGKHSAPPRHGIGPHIQFNHGDDESQS